MLDLRTYTYTSLMPISASYLNQKLKKYSTPNMDGEGDGEGEGDRESI